MFVYDRIDLMTCLKKVRNPIDLVKKLIYQQKNHRLPNETFFDAIFYVIRHTMRFESQQSAMITRYEYSNRNFLDFNGGRNSKNNENNLYHMSNNCEYKAFVIQHDEIIMKYYYNKFHLVIQNRRQQNIK